MCLGSTSSRWRGRTLRSGCSSWAGWPSTPSPTTGPSASTRARCGSPSTTRAAPSPCCTCASSRATATSRCPGLSTTRTWRRRATPWCTASCRGCAASRSGCPPSCTCARRSGTCSTPWTATSRPLDPTSSWCRRPSSTTPRSSSCPTTTSCASCCCADGWPLRPCWARTSGTCPERTPRPAAASHSPTPRKPHISRRSHKARRWATDLRQKDQAWIGRNNSSGAFAPLGWSSSCFCSVGLHSVHSGPWLLIVRKVAFLCRCTSIPTGWRMSIQP